MSKDKNLSLGKAYEGALVRWVDDDGVTHNGEFVEYISADFDACKVKDSEGEYFIESSVGEVTVYNCG